MHVYLCMDNKVALQYLHVHGHEAKLQGIYTYMDIDNKAALQCMHRYMCMEMKSNYKAYIHTYMGIDDKAALQCMYTCAWTIRLHYNTYMCIDMKPNYKAYIHGHRQ